VSSTRKAASAEKILQQGYVQAHMETLQGEEKTLGAANTVQNAGSEREMASSREGDPSKKPRGDADHFGKIPFESRGGTRVERSVGCGTTKGG